MLSPCKKPSLNQNYSFLTQELNNYYCPSPSPCPIPISIPIKYEIDIKEEYKKKTDKQENDECKLDIHYFDPAKSSPPSEWQTRLLKRINSLTSLHI